MIDELRDFPPPGKPAKTHGSKSRTCPATRAKGQGAVPPPPDQGSGAALAVLPTRSGGACSNRLPRPRSWSTPGAPQTHPGPPPGPRGATPCNSSRADWDKALRATAAPLSRRQFDPGCKHGVRAVNRFRPARSYDPRRTRSLRRPREFPLGPFPLIAHSITIPPSGVGPRTGRASPHKDWPKQPAAPGLPRRRPVPRAFRSQEFRPQRTVKHRVPRRPLTCISRGTEP